MKQIATALTLSFALLASAAAQTAQPPLVTWSGGQVDARDFQASLDANVPAANQREFTSDMKRITQILDQLHVQREIALRARRERLAEEPGVATQLRLAEERVLTSIYMNRRAAGLKRPDFEQAAREQYRLRLSEFAVGELNDTSHILVSIGSHRSEEQALARAEQLRKQILSGADLSQLAADFSDDPSAKRNRGNLGPMPVGSFVTEYDAAARKMKPGELSEPVRTSFGYHIIRLNRRDAPRTRAFEEVRDQLVAELEMRWIDTQQAEFLSTIRNDPSIQLNKAEIDKLVTPPLPVVPAGGARPR